MGQNKKPKVGVEAAAEILQNLGVAHANNLLDIIAEEEPGLAESLKNNMVKFEDLRFLTQKMLVELFKDIKPETMGLALRLGSNELRDHILNNVSTGMHLEMDRIINGPLKKASDVQEAVDSIMDVVRLKIEKGEILINSLDGDQIVE